VRTLVVTVGILVCTAAISAAQDRPAPWAEARGFVSIGSSINVNRPASGTNQLRIFDYEDRRLKLDSAELVWQRPVSTRGQFGFRADLVAGESIPRMTAASGLFRDVETGEAGNFDLQQMFVSYVVPVGSGLRIDAGKYTSHAGPEVIEGFDGFNDNYSRGMLFGFSEAGTFTGVRASYAFTPHVSALVSLSNGWDTVRDNNTGKTVGAQLALTPRDSVAVFLNYIGGPERTGSDLRQLFDVVAVLKPAAWSTVTVSYDFGHDANAIEPGIDATWQGASAIAAFKLGGVYGVAVRGEVFSDANGFRTGAEQTVAGFTVTPSVTANKYLTLRSDLRLDRSTQAVFETQDAHKQHQFTVAVNAVISF
jgi:hypothetical protein